MTQWTDQATDKKDATNTYSIFSKPKDNFQITEFSWNHNFQMTI